MLHHTVPVSHQGPEQQHSSSNNLFSSMTHRGNGQHTPHTGWLDWHNQVPSLFRSLSLSQSRSHSSSSLSTRQTGRSDYNPALPTFFLPPPHLWIPFSLLTFLTHTPCSYSYLQLSEVINLQPPAGSCQCLTRGMLCCSLLPAPCAGLQMPTSGKCFLERTSRRCCKFKVYSVRDRFENDWTCIFFLSCGKTSFKLLKFCGKTSIWNFKSLKWRWKKGVCHTLTCGQDPWQPPWLISLNENMNVLSPPLFVLFIYLGSNNKRNATWSKFKSIRRGADPGCSSGQKACDTHELQVLIFLTLLCILLFFHWTLMGLLSSFGVQ